MCADGDRQNMLEVGWECLLALLIEETWVKSSVSSEAMFSRDLADGQVWRIHVYLINR